MLGAEEEETASSSQATGAPAAAAQEEEDESSAVVVVPIGNDFARRPSYNRRHDDKASASPSSPRSFRRPIDVHLPSSAGLQRPTFEASALSAISWSSSAYSVPSVFARRAPSSLGPYVPEVSSYISR